jgi:hypothetical protein
MRSLVLVLSVGLASCGGPSEAKTARKASATGVLAYYPFEAGMQWSYMVYGAPGTPGLLSVDKVIAFDGTTAVVKSGDSTLTYRVTPEGIYREPAHTFLIKWPVVRGETWQGARGSRVEVTGVELRITVEAGVFDDCIEITETVGGDEAEMLRTTFCPDVGPVLIDIRELNTPPGAVPARLVGRLRAYGPPLTLPPPTAQEK